VISTIGPGTSSDPCSDLYHGPSAFSESETKAVSDYLTAHADEISLFVDVHSFSQLVLLPWGDTSELPDDYDELVTRFVHNS
jgi:carboxypeptidase A2